MPAKEVMRSEENDDFDELPEGPSVCPPSIQDDEATVMKARGDAIMRLYEEKVRDEKAKERIRVVEADLARMALAAKVNGGDDEDEGAAATAPPDGRRAVMVNNNFNLPVPAGDVSFPDVHPGMNVFSYRAKYFTSDMLNFSHLKKPANSFERELKRATCEDISEMISFGTFTFNYLSDKSGGIRFLVRFLSVSNRPDVIWSCVSLISELFRASPDLARFVTPQLIMEVLLNYGMTVNAFLPPEQAEYWSQQLADASHSSDIVGQEPVDPRKVEPFSATAVDSCLSSLCKIITVALEVGLAWNVDDLSTVATMLVAATLDKELNLSTNVFDVHECVDRLLNVLTEEEWSARIGPYVEAISRLCEHHHNMVYLMWSFPLSSRGRHLQHIVGSVMLQKLLGVEPPIAASRLSPRGILKLVESWELHRLEDYYLMHSVLHLIDFVIGTDLPIRKVKSMAALSAYLGQVAARIRDKSSGVSGWKVKDLLTQMRNKWVSMANNVPMAQRTLFSFMNTKEHSELDSQASDSMAESQD